MPWKHNGVTIKEGKSWSDGTYKHPYNWATAWSDKDKKRMGLTWKKPSSQQEPFDETFYSGRKKDGTLIERSLTDVIQKNDDGEIVGKIDGLKPLWIQRTKDKASSYLSKWDWQIVRKVEKDIAIDSSVATYRDAVRTACNTIETAISNCKTLADFIKLFDVPVDKDGIPTGKAPIYDFPNEI